MSFDIHFEGIGPLLPASPRFLTFGDYPRTLAVRGVQKMVNKFIKCLCTPVGTDLGDRAYGTRLMSLFLGNVSAAQARPLVVLAINEAAKTVQGYDVVNAPDSDERLSSAVLETFTVDEENNGFTLTVLLKNAAGTTVRVRVPDMPRA